MHRGDFLRIGRLLGAKNPKDGGALRVPDVVQLLVAGLAEYVVDIRGQIVFAHLVERKVPELLVVTVQAGVVLRVTIAARVAHPHIVAQIGEHVA